MQDYHTKLEGLLVPVAKRTSIGNPAFSEWDEHIRQSLLNRGDTPYKNYDNPIDGALLARCIEHSESFGKPIGPDVVVLTHPFYIFISHMGRLMSSGAESDAIDYKRNLMRFFDRRASLEASVVLLETIHYYADSSSVLLEDGVIDKVIFTEYDRGAPLNRWDFKPFKERRVYFGGSYNGICLSHSISNMRCEVKPVDRLKVIPDLVLESPLEYVNSLKPKLIFVDGMPLHDDQLISLNELFRKFAA